MENHDPTLSQQILDVLHQEFLIFPSPYATIPWVSLERMKGRGFGLAGRHYDPDQLGRLPLWEDCGVNVAWASAVLRQPRQRVGNKPARIGLDKF